MSTIAFHFPYCQELRKYLHFVAVLTAETQHFPTITNIHNAVCLAFTSVLFFILLFSNSVILFCSLAKISILPSPFHTHVFLPSVIIFQLCLGKLFMVFPFWTVEIRQRKGRQWLMPLSKQQNILMCRIFAFIKLFAHVIS